MPARARIELRSSADGLNSLRAALRSLRIQNFKAWRDTRTIELAPLTLLFGTNSSGKSSINHLLMMLRQTADSPDRNNVFDYGDENAAVRLGSFRDIVYQHDLERDLFANGDGPRCSDAEVPQVLGGISGWVPDVHAVGRT